MTTTPRRALLATAALTLTAAAVSCGSGGGAAAQPAPPPALPRQAVYDIPRGTAVVAFCGHRLAIGSNGFPHTSHGITAAHVPAAT